MLTFVIAKRYMAEEQRCSRPVQFFNIVTFFIVTFSQVFPIRFCFFDIFPKIQFSNNFLPRISKNVSFLVAFVGFVTQTRLLANIFCQLQFFFKLLVVTLCNVFCMNLNSFLICMQTKI